MFVLGGKIIVFSGTISSIGCGKTNIRNDASLHNKPEEAKIMMPGNNFYTELAKTCLQNRISVDIFYGMAKQHPGVDLATVAPICGQTGG